MKNSARHHELTLADKACQLKDSMDLFVWARDMSGLAIPKHTLFEKKGKGIYRRFFYWIPSKGTGSVNRSRLPKLIAEGTSRLHEFVDIGVPSVVSTRRASCHRCDACWSFNFRECVNQGYVGNPSELQIRREVVPASAVQRVERATLNREAIARANEAELGCVVCIQTHRDEQSHPWVIGEVVECVHSAPANSPPHDPSSNPVHFDAIKVNEPALKVRLYEALEAGSSTFFQSDSLIVLVAARKVKVINLEVECTRSASRLQTMSRPRFKLSELSMARIREAMPTSDDDWEVGSILQYRCLYGVEQWLVKWVGYADNMHNTWEPW